MDHFVRSKEAPERAISSNDSHPICCFVVQYVIATPPGTVYHSLRFVADEERKRCRFIVIRCCEREFAAMLPKVNLLLIRIDEALYCHRFLAHTIQQLVGGASSEQSPKSQHSPNPPREGVRG